MKRSLSILLVLSLVFSLFVVTGCAADKNEADKTVTADKTEIVLQIGSPVMMVNGEVYGRLTPDDVPGVVEKYRAMESDPA